MTQNEVRSIVEDLIRDRTNTNWDEIVQHYISLKSKLPKALLLYRVGYWYFAFDSDAKTIARELDLTTITSTLLNLVEIKIPRYCLSNSIKQLLERGYIIATYDRPFHRVEQLKAELQS